MRKLYFLFCLLVIANFSKAQSTYHISCADIFISEYDEPGPGYGGSKVIELYNPTNSAINLSNYNLSVENNGNCNITNTFYLPSYLLQPDSVYVINNGTSGNVDPLVAAERDTTWSNLNFNGNDVIYLINSFNGDTLDMIGFKCVVFPSSPGFPVGVADSTHNITLVRKPYISFGEKDWNVSRYQWDVYPGSTFSFVGWHTMYPCGYHPTVGFETNTDTVLESVGSHQIPLTLQYPNGDTTFVTVQVIGGSATSGSDYNTTTQTLVFLPYSQYASGYLANDTIHIIDDLIPEPTESVQFLITSTFNKSSLVDSFNGNHTLYILDNDFAPQISFTQPTYWAVNENFGTMYLPIQLNQIPSASYSVTVAVNLLASTTQPADYIFTTQTITFPAGKQYDTIAFTIVDDCITEGVESPVLQLYNPTNGATLGTDSVLLIDINPNDSLPNILFPASTSYIESAGSITVPVALSHRYCDTVVVYTNINGTGTAIWNVDYNNISQNDSIIFYPGDSLKFITLHIIDDNIQESTESIIIDISTINNGVTNVYGSTTVFIQDNDGPPVYSFLTPFGISVNETATTYQIPVAANGAIGATPYTVNVYFDAVNSTATSGSDFTFTNQTVTFTSPKDTQYFAVTVINDCLPENLETIKLKLRNAVNGTLGNDSIYTLNINQNDTLPNAYVLSATTSIVENAGSAYIVVGLNQPFCDTVKVQVNLANNTAIAGSDYNNTSFPTTLVFPPNTIGPLTVLIPIIDDNINEPTEWFDFNLTSVSNCTITNYSADSIIIIDNDPPTLIPSIQFQNTSANWIESVGTVQIPITITNPNSSPTSVTVTITGGTATSGSDYYATSPQVITFPANSSATQYFSVHIIDDLITEPTENLTIVLSNPTNSAQLGTNNTFSGSILDNDAVTLPSVQFAQTNYSYIESAGTISIPITISTPNNANLTFGYTLSGSATLNADYSMITTSPVSVVATYTSSSIQLHIVDDNLIESTENIILSLSAINNCTIGNNISCQISILDNDTTASSTGVTNLMKNSIKLFPNPVASNGILHSSGTDENMQFELYNILGEKMLTTTFAQQAIKLSEYNLNSGVYLYKIISKENGLVKEGKLMIK